MMLVIATQDYENYAAHQGFDGTYYWKAKGGSEYKVTNLPKDFDVEAILDMVRGDIERNDDYFQVQVIGFKVESDDYLSWFEKSQLEYEGEITHREPEIEYSEINDRYTDPMEYAEICADNDAAYYGA